MNIQIRSFHVTVNEQSQIRWVHVLFKVALVDLHQVVVTFLSVLEKLNLLGAEGGLDGTVPVQSGATLNNLKHLESFL